METNKDILKQIKTKTQPKMDEAYFDQFRANMMQEIKKYPKTRVFYLRPVFWLSAAAASVILIFGIRMFNTEKQVSFSNLSEHEILTYIDETSDEIENLPEIKDLTTDPKTVKDNTHKTAVASDKNVQLASLPDFVSSDEILEELSEEDIYQYMNSEEFDIEELELIN